ncbi:hypothetical protein KSS87_021236 [Heliosperma pusillum]|nr:hypothetical protein KSS87_021236 [Heliosperma pusillum]
MTPIACDKSKSFVTIPKGKVNMSYEDTLREMEAFLDGRLENPLPGEEAYADITEITNTSSFKLPDAYDPDATENSSSFGDTTSRSAITSVASDAEVESEFHADNELGSMFDSYSSIFPTRKKKLTTQWRNFIRPLMWRCKWTELKIKELESQALKYTRELEPNYQTKMSELQQQTSDFCSKSVPFISQTVRKKAMKRRKRKRLEIVTDISSYMSHHQLFSYLENKKADPDGATAPEDDCSKEGKGSEGHWRERKGREGKGKRVNVYSKIDEYNMDDNWLKDDDDSMEQILRQIETVQCQVHSLRNHLDLVMLKNGVKFSSSENLSLLVPYDGQTSAAQSPAFSAGNGDNMSLGAKYSPKSLLDFDIGDLGLPENIISGYGDGSQIPDVIESTVGLLSATDVTPHQPQIVESAENMLDNSLVHINVMPDGNPSNGVVDHLTGHRELQEPEVKDVKLLVLPTKTKLAPDTMVGDDISLPKSSVIKSCITKDAPPKNKKKRGERKAAPGGWNLKLARSLGGLSVLPLVGVDRWCLIMALWVSRSTGGFTSAEASKKVGYAQLTQKAIVVGNGSV